MDLAEVTPIVQLRPYTKMEKIKVRVCRIWKSNVPGTIQKHVNLHCILVDEMNHAVEASTKDIDYEVIASKIEAGSSYEIMNFRTIKIRGQYKVVPHETQIILTDTTVFKKLSNVFSPIPRHWFFLQDCNSLYPHLDKVDILTDVIGHLTAIQHLEPKQINQRIVQKCDVRIENIRKEELSITLWAEVAERFSSLSLQASSLPIVIVFTSLKVRPYLQNIVLNSTAYSLFFIDPDIPELNSYKSMFSNSKDPVKTLPPLQVNSMKLRFYGQQGELQSMN
ncbi:replication protein A 70 kDa DNA-binding subunit B-like [Malus domestica]|uniref:replication protein A 70 kDa DNA-binding subunit B-like n=1 Tax=Malus domestica TaxID=3750 RepID=UPI003976AC3B